MTDLSLGQAWVSRVTSADGEDVPVIGSDVSPAPEKCLDCGHPVACHFNGDCHALANTTNYCDCAEMVAARTESDTPSEEKK